MGNEKNSEKIVMEQGGMGEAQERRMMEMAGREQSLGEAAETSGYSEGKEVRKNLSEMGAIATDMERLLKEQGEMGRQGAIFGENSGEMLPPERINAVDKINSINSAGSIDLAALRGQKPGVRIGFGVVKNTETDVKGGVNAQITKVTENGRVTNADVERINSAVRDIDMPADIVNLKKRMQAEMKRAKGK